MKDILSIRLNDQDKEDIKIIKEFLKNRYKDLPAFIRQVTDTDAVKWAIYLASERIKANRDEHFD